MVTLVIYYPIQRAKRNKKNTDLIDLLPQLHMMTSLWSYKSKSNLEAADEYTHNKNNIKCSIINLLHI